MKVRAALSLFLFILYILPTLAQQGKFEIIKSNYSNEEITFPANKKVEIFYDSKVFGSPKFRPGYIITLTKKIKKM